MYTKLLIPNYSNYGYDLRIHDSYTDTMQPIDDRILCCDALKYAIYI